MSGNEELGGAETISNDEDLSLFLQGSTDNAGDEPEPDAEETLEGQSEAEEEGEVDGEPEAELAENEAEEADETDADPLVEISTKNGGTQRIKMSELKDGYMRQSDYSRKTAEMAEARAEVAGMKSQLEERLTAVAVTAPQEPNWTELARTLDPQTYNLRRAQWAEHQSKVADAREQLARMKEAQNQERLESARDKLLQIVPSWADDAVATQEMTEAVAFVGESGVSAEAFREAVIGSPEIISIVRDAMAYRAGKTQNARTEKLVAETPQTLRPGSQASRQDRRSRRQKAAKDRFLADGTNADAFVDYMLTE